MPPVHHLAPDFGRHAKELGVKRYRTSTEALSKGDAMQVRIMLPPFCERPSIPQGLNMALNWSPAAPRSIHVLLIN